MVHMINQDYEREIVNKKEGIHGELRWKEQRTAEDRWYRPSVIGYGFQIRVYEMTQALSSREHMSTAVRFMCGLAELFEESIIQRLNKHTRKEAGQCGETVPDMMVWLTSAKSGYMKRGYIPT